jgi:hypothetical protein
MSKDIAGTGDSRTVNIKKDTSSKGPTNDDSASAMGTVENS